MRSGAAGLLLSLLVLGAEGSPATELSLDELSAWAAGPVQWLFLPADRKALKQVEDRDDAAAFVEFFWSRRGVEPGSSYQQEFEHRVQAADVLYDDEGPRGSLTDRGRALILMGPPTHITVTTEPVMAWDPASNTDDRVTMRDVNVEIWGYKLQDLPQGMLEIWMAKKKRAAEDTLALTLMFRNVGKKTSLVQGEPLLEAAAKAAVIFAAD